MWSRDRCLLQDDIAAALARPASEGDDGSTDSAGDQPDGRFTGVAGPSRNLVAELLADRTADSSLTPIQDHPRDGLA